MAAEQPGFHQRIAPAAGHEVDLRHGEGEAGIEERRLFPPASGIRASAGRGAGGGRDEARQPVALAGEAGRDRKAEEHDRRRRPPGKTALWRVDLGNRGEDSRLWGPERGCGVLG